jgi:hypothetical protein
LVVHDLLPEVLHLVIARLQKLSKLNNASLQIRVVLQDVTHKMGDHISTAARFDTLQGGRTFQAAFSATKFSFEYSFTLQPGDYFLMLLTVHTSLPFDFLHF